MDFSRVSGGIFPASLIRDLIHANHVFGAFPDTITNAFLPLTATSEIYRIPGILIPQSGERVRSLLKKTSGLRLPPGSPLEAGCSYLVRLRETLVLPPEVFARFSSPGARFDLALVADGVSFLDEISSGYVGELWVIVTPHEGPVFLGEDETLGSLSFFTEHTPLSFHEALSVHHDSALFYDRDGNAMMPFVHRGHGISLTLHADAPFFLRASSRHQTETAECVRLSQEYAAQITCGYKTSYLPPEFGSSSPTGTPLSLPLPSSQDAFWQPGQPVCTFELLPVATRKHVPETLCTQAPPPNVKTE